MQNINGFVSVPVSFAGLQTIDQQPAGQDPLLLPPFLLSFLKLLDPFHRCSRSAFMARSGPFPSSRLRSRSRSRRQPLRPVPGTPAVPAPVPVSFSMLTAITISSNILP